MRQWLSRCYRVLTNDLQRIREGHRRRTRIRTPARNARYPAFEGGNFGFRVAEVSGQGIELDYSDELGPLEGMSTGGRITLRQGLSPAEEFSTLAHELAHEMLHRDRDRGKTTKKVRDAKSYVYSWPHEGQLKPGDVGQVHVAVGIIVGAGAARIGNSPRPGQAAFE